MKKLFVSLLAGVLFLFLIQNDFAFTNSSGAPPAKTGAPGEGDCTSCHGGALNSGPGNVSINVDLNGQVNYMMDSNYLVTVDVTDATKAAYGFSMVALDQNGNNAGTFSVINASNTKLSSLQGKSYAGHKDALSAGVSSWTLNWVAPSTNIGNVTFYASGNAVNGQQNVAGDNVYTSSETISAPTTTSLDFMKKNELRVYPNPVTDCVNVTISETLDKIQILDFNGGLLIEKNNPKMPIKVNLSRFENGVYLFKATKNGKNWTEKIIKTTI
tara:strand:+ start:75 stop:887 length:813 start_codon:yes stop_codon:yes gene_type:complete